MEHSPEESPCIVGRLATAGDGQSALQLFTRPWFKSFEAQTVDPPPKHP